MKHEQLLKAFGPSFQQQQIEQLTAALRAPLYDDLAKDLSKFWRQPASSVTGLTAYNLEGPAKTLYPVLTPLRNRIPRVQSRGDSALHWRAVTGVNTTYITAGVSEGNRNQPITETTADFVASFKGLGMENYYTMEALYAGETFDDIRMRTTLGGLNSLMIQEEGVILGGNGTAIALGTPTAPTVVGNTTGGVLADASTYSVIVVALTLEGWLFTGNTMGAVSAATPTITQSYTRTPADGAAGETVNGGTSIKSAASAQTTISGGTNHGSLSCSTPVVTGAVAYAWFVGLTAGTERLAYISSGNSCVITALNGTGQVCASVFTTDCSKNGYLPDGILSQLWQSGSGATITTLPTGTPGTGSTLTSDAANGIVEINAMLQTMWDTKRLQPDIIWCNSQQQRDITRKVFATGGTPLVRYIPTDGPGLSNVIGGAGVYSYFNPFGGGKLMQIIAHPNMPPGTMLFWTDTLPYPHSNVARLVQIACRRDYYQINWPMTSRKQYIGFYCDELIQIYWPAAFGILTNIAAG